MVNYKHYYSLSKEENGNPRENYPKSGWQNRKASANEPE
jgi:hypothetical protein